MSVSYSPSASASSSNMVLSKALRLAGRFRPMTRTYPSRRMRRVS
ncbi:Uncharacterised protein [Mycobacteroides abscessus subsp. abscessus]|nr:Uncharacterised protein [Mycobacteroides abscessus subsp. abscessus]